MPSSYPTSKALQYTSKMTVKCGNVCKNLDLVRSIIYYCELSLQIKDLD